MGECHDLRHTGSGAGDPLTSVGLTAVLTTAAGGALLHNPRDGYALWLDWLSPLAGLPLRAPSFLRGPTSTAVAQTAIWGVSLLAGWAAILAVERKWKVDRGGRALTTVLASAGAIMLAYTVVWATGSGPPIDASAAQLQLLRAYDPKRMPLAVEYRPFRWLAAGAVPPRLELPSSTRQNPLRVAPRFFLPWLPGGTFRVRVRGPQPEALSLAIGREQQPLFRWELARDGSHTAQADFFLPADVRFVTIAAQGIKRSAARQVTLQPLALLEPAERLTPAMAREGRTYGPVAVFPLSETASLDSKRLRITDGADAQLIVDRRTPGGSVRIVVRNGPVANRVSLASGSWREIAALAPGEVRPVDVPMHGRRASLLSVRTTAGFRLPGSGGGRWIGCWIEF